jgi:hypothetical protein
MQALLSETTDIQNRLDDLEVKIDWIFRAVFTLLCAENHFDEIEKEREIKMMKECQQQFIMIMKGS